ncbi:hypothetical protein V6N13_085177 [Hibiscus sabdariffa]
MGKGRQLWGSVGFHGDFVDYAKIGFAFLVGGVQAWGQGGTDPFVDLESAVTACCRIDEGITDVVQGKVDMEISSAKNELSPYSQMKKSKKIVSGGINPHAVRKTPWVSVLYSYRRDDIESYDPPRK